MKLSVFGIGLIVICAILFSVAFPYITADSATFTVIDKERIVEKSGDSISSKYLVFTASETFENTDCLMRFKFNSSDLQGKLAVGETYTANVYGWRVPFLSMYRNIVSIN